MFNQLIRPLRQAALCGLVLAIGAERAAEQTALDGTTFTYGNTVFDIGSIQIAPFWMTAFL